MDTLLARIEAYRHRWLLERSAVGVLFLNDPALMTTLEANPPRKIRLKTLDKIERFLLMTPDEVTVARANDKAARAGEKAA